jgi:glycosyltransferase involved in cell wall biosynthesis
MPAIAFIMQAFYGDSIGGAERQVQLLGQALREAGWKTSYLCERPVDRPVREVVQGMDVLALPTRKKRWSLSNYSALRAAMEASRADLFYQRVRHQYTGMGAAIAHSLGKPFVWAVASTADVIRATDLRFASYANSALDTFVHPLNRYIEDRGIMKADSIILQTEDQKKLLEANYRRSGIVIPNHIRIQADLKVEKEQPPLILWVSNIKPFKRPEAFLELTECCSDLNAHFSMVGICPNEGTLRKITGTQKRVKTFRYTGALPPEETERHIAKATVLVNTSYFEGFPNAFQQAWEYGVPVLSLGVDPDGIIVREGLGRCCSDLHDLESELRKLLADAPRREEIGRLARNYALQHFDINKLLPRYLSLFDRLLKP